MSSTCPQCVYTCVHPFVPLHTSEWAFDQRFCYFPKDNFILGHPVDKENIFDKKDTKEINDKYIKENEIILINRKGKVKETET